jgi:hypothetical protein
VNIKDAAYVPPLTNILEDLAGSIRVAVATATLNLLNNMWTETKYKYDICWATDGALTEYFLNVSHKK